MLPSIADGDGLVAVRAGGVRPGQRRVFEHPHRPGTWLVKRVERVEGNRMWVRSDNAEETRADSRTFGSLPVAGSYRVVLRIPARFLGA